MKPRSMFATTVLLITVYCGANSPAICGTSTLDALTVNKCKVLLKGAEEDMAYRHISGEAACCTADMIVCQTKGK